MHAAPPVEVDTVPGAHAAGLVAALIGCGSAVLVAWARPLWVDDTALPPEWRMPAALGFAAVALSALAMAGRTLRGWMRAGVSSLRWDGQAWSLIHGDQSRGGHAQPMLDLGPWILVRFVPRTGDLPSPRRSSARWLPLSQGAAPARWAALRGALWNGRHP